MFFRDQSPRNLLCSGFLGTKPLSIPSHHPRSQEAKNLFTAASCSFFFEFTKSEHYQLIFIIGRVSEGTWVFGTVERGSGRALTFCGESTRETLVTRLVQEFIQPGTVILSDKFSPYFNLNDIGYKHLIVNHSENFVDP